MTRYRVFTRTWWINNPARVCQCGFRFHPAQWLGCPACNLPINQTAELWPGGLEPGAGAKHTLGFAYSEDEARGIAQRWNACHKPGRLSRKAEYERL
jgi:hypothetical protein